MKREHRERESKIIFAQVIWDLFFPKSLIWSKTPRLRGDISPAVPAPIVYVPMRRNLFPFPACSTVVPHVVHYTFFRHALFVRTRKPLSSCCRSNSLRKFPCLLWSTEHRTKGRPPAVAGHHQSLFPSLTPTTNSAECFMLC